MSADERVSFESGTVRKIGNALRLNYSLCILSSKF